jgi:hypothetical protein
MGVNTLPLRVVVPDVQVGICAQSGQGALHTPGVRAPQVCPFGQVPQSIDAPQPSPMEPQYWVPSASVQLSFVGQVAPPPQMFAAPLPPQVQPVPRAEQSVPQSCVPPQPFAMTPQYLPPDCVQLTAVEHPGEPPQTLAVPAPPHVCPAGQAAVQSIEPPHPSPRLVPQYWPPAGLQLSFVVHVLAGAPQT